MNIAFFICILLHAIWMKSIVNIVSSVFYNIWLYILSEHNYEQKNGRSKRLSNNLQ